MQHYKITCNGINYGLYESTSASGALDKMLADSGYDSRDELPDHVDPDAFTVTEMELKNSRARGTILQPAS